MTSLRAMLDGGADAQRISDGLQRERDRKRAEFRRRMPDDVVRWLDMMRSEFGTVRVTFAKFPDGETVGRLEKAVRPGMWRGPNKREPI